jgi:Ala-tRNA(Pro) deacylase
MAVPKKIINFLDKEKVKYEVIEHRKVFTAYDKAATLKIDEKVSVKTLAVKIIPPSKEVILVSIPANKNLDKDKLKKKINLKRKKEGEKSVKNIDFVTEKWLKANLKGVKPGAIPPFGNLWKLNSFIDKSLFNNPKIVLNSGDNSFSIKISPKKLEKNIPNLTVASISQPRKKKKKLKKTQKKKGRKKIKKITKKKVSKKKKKR